MKARIIFLFFVLTLALSWLAWVPAAIAKLNGETSFLAPESFLGGVLARWMPGIIAALLALYLGGKTELADLFRPIKTWRVGLVWYLFALLFQVGLFYIARLVDGIRGISPEVVSPLVSMYGVEMAALMTPVLILSALPGAFAEELGWRGFALPRLQQKSSPLIASLVIAIIWGIWHLPLLVYFGEFAPNDIASMAMVVLNFIPITLLYTWLYNRTHGSLLLVTLFHAGQQFSNNFLGTWPTITDELILWVLALGVLYLYRKEFFARVNPYESGQALP